MDWQPIETAPEDGGEVLFFHPEQGMAVWPAPARWPGVTHWMPLPPEPPMTARCRIAEAC